MLYHSWTTQKENVQKFLWNIFIISIHGLVYFHQNTKQNFGESQETKDAIILKQHQQFVLECIVLIIVDDVNVEVLSITCIGFIQLGDVWLLPSFSPRNSLCMLMASNKSPHNTVMKERVLDIVLLNVVSLEFAISALKASQNIICPYLVVFWQVFRSSI
jgi:hypothetical protein